MQVTIVENSATGNLDFTVDVLDHAPLTADLRGLFFHLVDESLLPGLQVTGGGGLITEVQKGPTASATSARGPT